MEPEDDEAATLMEQSWQFRQVAPRAGRGHRPPNRRRMRGPRDEQAGAPPLHVSRRSVGSNPVSVSFGPTDAICSPRSSLWSPWPR